MYDNIKRIEETLEQVSLEEPEHGVFNLKALVSDKLIYELCEDITEISRYSKEGMNFWHRDLSRTDKLKVIFLLEHYIENKSNELGIAVCVLTHHMVLETLTVPCMIQRTIENEQVSYIEACEDVMGFYLPRDEFESYHEKAHEVLALTYAAKTKDTQTFNISII